MSIEDDQTRSLRPTPRGSPRPARSWLVAGVLLAALLLVVAVAVLGRPAQLPPTAAPAIADLTTTSSPVTAVDTPAVVATSSPERGEVCVPNPQEFTPGSPPDLTGLWAGDDGGIYYVRQLGSVIWWNGMSNRDDPPTALGRFWNNVGRGEIEKDLTIVSDWADVPRGQVRGYGTVTFKIGADADGNLQITKQSETGTGRGDTQWTPCLPA